MTWDRLERLLVRAYGFVIRTHVHPCCTMNCFATSIALPHVRWTVPSVLLLGPTWRVGRALAAIRSIGEQLKEIGRGGCNLDSGTRGVLFNTGFRRNSGHHGGLTVSRCQSRCQSSAACQYHTVKQKHSSFISGLWTRRDDVNGAHQTRGRCVTSGYE